MKIYEGHPKIYYHVSWDSKNWQFLQHGIHLSEVHWTESGFILKSDYKEDFYDSSYITDSNGTPGTRADYCFKADEQDVFEDLTKAKEYYKLKAREMYKYRLNLLLEEYETTLKKIENGNNS